MGLLDRTVVGVDGSEGSSAAFKWAVAQAGATDPHGTVVAVHAFSPGVEVFAAAAQMNLDPIRIERRRLLENRWTASAEGTGVKVIAELIDDEPATALMRASESNGNAPIVVGHQGHSRWARHHIGHVGGQLLHRAEAPVILTNDSTPPVPVTGPVVVGVHGATDPGHRPLAWAARFAEERGLRLHLVSVATPLVVGPGYGYPGAAYDRYLSSIEEDTRVAVAKLATDLAESRPDLEVTSEVSFGHPTDVLAELIGNVGAGLAVMGGHHPSALASFLADGVSRHLPTMVDCPVAVVCAD